VRRWVLHVLPRGFVKMRHYGLLANRGRAERLTVCRTLLALGTVVQMVVGGLGSGAEAACGARRCCPACGSAQWLSVAALPATAAELVAGAGSGAAAPDTS
jgi:hypothetical protein